MINNHHNEKGWMLAKRWLKSLRKSVVENNKSMFINLIEKRERNIFYLKHDNHAMEDFFLYCELGLDKFNLGIE